MRYRSPSVFSLGRWSSLLPAGFLVSCGTLVPACLFRLSFTGLLPSSVGLSRPLQLNFQVHVADPQPRTSVDVRFGLFPVRSPLLRESFLLSFPPGTEMFQFPGFPPHGLWDSSMGDWTLLQPGSPIRTSTTQSPLTAPRGFSQLVASFFGKWRLGIHPVPLFA